MENSTNSLTTLEVNPDVIAHGLTSSVGSALNEKQLSDSVQAIKSATTSYPANGSVASMIFYLKFQVSVKNGGKTFDGNAGGIAVPGGGALIGDVYTSDINRLYSDTVSFAFTATPVYTALYFYDGHSNLLGTFQGGSVSTVTGTGGGSGKWS